MSGQLLLISILAFTFTWLELSHRLRPHSPLQLKTSNWKVSQTDYGLQVIGILEITNPHRRMEVMVPELVIKPILLGKEKVNNIQYKTFINALHPDEDIRKDGYWQAYIVKSRKSTRAEITITLNDNIAVDAINDLENIWVEIHWINYGPFGRIKKRQGVVVPVKRPIPLSADQAYFKQYKSCQLLPIKTHLLGTNDNISNVIEQYVSRIIKPGDILTIGETPVAIMQGRFRHPSTVKPGLTAKSFCYAFHPTSSLATACGLQTLVDLVGPSRVIISIFIGAIGKLFGIKGLFYRLAGEQARLIDDITGTTPPYDQNIVLGPKSPKKVCDETSKQLGIKVAIVDVNDLGRVKVLAASNQCNKSFLRKALRTNPAGNANEQTPLVLIRPYQ